MFLLRMAAFWGYRLTFTLSLEIPTYKKLAINDCLQRGYGLTLTSRCRYLSEIESSCVLACCSHGILCWVPRVQRVTVFANNEHNISKTCCYSRLIVWILNATHWAFKSWKYEIRTIKIGAMQAQVFGAKQKYNWSFFYATCVQPVPPNFTINGPRCLLNEIF